MTQKVYNWQTLNTRALKKRLPIPREEFMDVCNCRPSVERVLKLCKFKMAGFRTSTA